MNRSLSVLLLALSAACGGSTERKSTSAGGTSGEGGSSGAVGAGGSAGRGGVSGAGAEGGAVGAAACRVPEPKEALGLSAACDDYWNFAWFIVQQPLRL